MSVEKLAGFLNRTLDEVRYSWAVVLSMERQSDCSPLSGPRLHRFGQLNDPGKRLGRGTIVRAGFCSTTTQSNLTTRWDGNH